ncbi:MAG TPA: biotin-dependent carboxyltransferase family protein [Bacillota bacterium]|nr:biotin-dependent carboxyltransferase family protein [Bacillota bacterium]
MGIDVLQPGFFSTVQDLGRYNFQKFGMIVSGVMDNFATRIANILVGNDEGEAVIETMLHGLKIKINEDTVIAITGSKTRPLLNGAPIPMWRPVYVHAGDIISMPKLDNGLFTYIAFSGGLNIPVKFGSKSTYLSANFGGHEGRTLKKNDYIPFENESNENRKIKKYLKNNDYKVSWFVRYHDFYALTHEAELKVIEGKEFDWFTEESKNNFLKDPFTLSPESNRMGFKLNGPNLQTKQQQELLSEGVTYGTIQVPSSGQPIVLMADHQTIGGYPKIGQLISANFSKLAQLQPGAKIKFTRISLEEAERMYIKKEQIINHIKQSISLKI